MEPYIISSLLSRRASQWLRASHYVVGTDDTNRIIAKRGGFHIARIAAHLWRGSDEWKITRDVLQGQINELEQESLGFSKQFDSAFKILSSIIKDAETYSGDPDRALKSSALDRDMDKYLHKSRKKRKA